MFSWHFLCQDSAGKVFDVIFMDNAAKSGSAFSPADGTMQGVKQWLTSPTKMASHVTWEKVPAGVKAIIESLIKASNITP
jgi:hypothetical protein